MLNPRLQPHFETCATHADVSLGGGATQGGRSVAGAISPIRLPRLRQPNSPTNPKAGGVFVNPVELESRRGRRAADRLATGRRRAAGQARGCGGEVSSAVAEREARLADRRGSASKGVGILRDGDVIDARDEIDRRWREPFCEEREGSPGGR